MRDAKEKESVTRKRGWVFLALWAVFIAAGIISKRVFGHPDMMVFYHLPAAVFLVVGWFHLSAKVRQRYRETVARTLAKRSPLPYGKGK